MTLCVRMLDVRDVYGDVKTHFVDPIPRPSLPSKTLLDLQKKCTVQCVELTIDWLLLFVFYMVMSIE